MQAELKAEMKRADKLAKLVMDFSQNEGGETLANVHTSQGFQEVWDHRGSEKVRWRLERKMEQVSARYDAKTQLFQRTFYTKGLTLADEREMRAAFDTASNAYDMQRMVGQAALFIGFFPMTYRLAASVRPITLVLWTGAYYFGAYKNGLEPLAIWNFQRSINSSARPFAEKYNV